MRCYCCDRVLTTQEACAQFKSGDFTEMCNKCINAADLQSAVLDKEKPEDGEIPLEFDNFDEPSELDIEDSFLEGGEDDD